MIFFKPVCALRHSAPVDTAYINTILTCNGEDIEDTVMTPIFLEFPETNEYYQAQTSATFIKEFVEGDIIAVKAKYHGGSVTQIIIAGTGVSTFGGEYGSTQLGYCLVEIV